MNTSPKLTSLLLAGCLLLASRPVAAAQAESYPAEDPFQPPDGLVSSPESLLCANGFFGAKCFVYSPSNCFRLASACYRRGFFEDAVALLTHAIEQEPLARYYYLRGLAQMQIHRCDDAIESAQGVWDAQAAGLAAGLAPVRERFNGPVAAQFHELVLLKTPASRPLPLPAVTRPPAVAPPPAVTPPPSDVPPPAANPEPNATLPPVTAPPTDPTPPPAAPAAPE